MVQGHLDKGKHSILHIIITLRQNYVKIIASTCEVRNFRISSDDVAPAYLQRDEKLRRKIYLKQSKNDFQFLNFNEGQTFFLILLLYGLMDSCDYWEIT